MSEKLYRPANAIAATTADRWITINEAAEIAGMKPNTMYAYCSRRLLESVKIGKMRRIKYTTLLEWLEGCTVKATAHTPQEAQHVHQN